MKVYLAASWSRLGEMRQVALELRKMGVTVDCRWLDEDPLPLHGQEKFHRENALNDVADIRNCDVLVRFTDDLSGPSVPSHLATGARMFEQGLAFAIGKPIYVVGGQQHIFDRLPGMVHVRDVAHLKRELCPEEIN